MNRARRRPRCGVSAPSAAGGSPNGCAVWHLRLRGWRIVARGWRCPAGEIDILARRGAILAVIEVKSRGDLATRRGALPPRQRRRITRAAEAFLTTHPEFAGLGLRFDLMLVAPRRLPHHRPGAWRADG